MHARKSLIYVNLLVAYAKMKTIINIVGAGMDLKSYVVANVVTSTKGYENLLLVDL